MIYNETLIVSLRDYKCSSCTLYIVLFAVLLTTSVIISVVFIYFHWYLKESNYQLYYKKILFVLHLIQVLKQQFFEHINENLRKS